MRSCFIGCVAALWAFPDPAFAGAWMRETGKTFTEVAFGITYNRDTASTTYIEHGLREGLTLGADIGFMGDSAGNQRGYGTLFFRRPLGQKDKPSQWAYEVGLGAGWTETGYVPHLKTGLSWGRGITLRETSGWATVDGSVTWDLGNGDRLIKVDGTVGLNFTDHTTGIVQLFLAHADRKMAASVAPSVVIKTPSGKLRYKVGFESELGNIENTALKIGIWREF